MSQIPPVFEQQRTPSDRDYLGYLSRVLIRMWGQLARVVNGEIEVYKVATGKDSAVAPGTAVAGNLKGYWWEGSIGGGGTTVNHNLGYTPKGIIVVYNSSSSSVWVSGTPTKTQITLQCTSGTNVKGLIV